MRTDAPTVCTDVIYGIVQSISGSEGFLLCEHKPEIMSPSLQEACLGTQVSWPSVKTPLKTPGRSWQNVRVAKLRPLIKKKKLLPKPIRAIVTGCSISVNHLSVITKLPLTSTKSVDLEETIPHLSLFISRCGVWRARANIHRPVCLYHSAGIRH